MSAVAQSLQAAALALQRAAAVTPGGTRSHESGLSDVASPTRGEAADVVARVPGHGEAVPMPIPRAPAARDGGERDATAAKLAGAAQRVRADWLGGNGGMLSQLSIENAALREALDDTTRKLNELEVERTRLAKNGPRGAAESIEKASMPTTEPRCSEPAAG